MTKTRFAEFFTQLKRDQGAKAALTLARVSASRILALLSGEAHLAGARREGLRRSMVLPAAGGGG